jgi:hypothetical protein
VVEDFAQRMQVVQQVKEGAVSEVADTHGA